MSFEDSLLFIEQRLHEVEERIRQLKGEKPASSPTLFLNSSHLRLSFTESSSSFCSSSTSSYSQRERVELAMSADETGKDPELRLRLWRAVVQSSRGGKISADTRDHLILALIDYIRHEIYERQSDGVQNSRIYARIRPYYREALDLINEVLEHPYQPNESFTSVDLLYMRLWCFKATVYHGVSEICKGPEKKGLLRDARECYEKAYNTRDTVPILNPTRLYLVDRYASLLFTEFKMKKKAERILEEEVDAAIEARARGDHEEVELLGEDLAILQHHLECFSSRGLKGRLRTQVKKFVERISSLKTSRESSINL